MTAGEHNFAANQAVTFRCYAECWDHDWHVQQGNSLEVSLQNVEANLRRFASNVTIPRGGSSAPRVQPNLLTNDVLCFTVQWTPTQNMISSSVGAQILASLDWQVRHLFSDAQVQWRHRWYEHAPGPCSFYHSLEYSTSDCAYVVDASSVTLGTRQIETNTSGSRIGQVANAVNMQTQVSTDPNVHGNTATENNVRDTLGMDPRLFLYGGIIIMGAFAFAALYQAVKS